MISNGEASEVKDEKVWQWHQDQKVTKDRSPLFKGSKEMSRFDYVKYDEPSAKLQSEFKDKFLQLEDMLKKQIAVMPLTAGMYLDSAMESLEMAYAWIGKAIREDQISRTGVVELQEDRKDS